MALTMGLSGMFNVGHDIGGFAGPVPDAELLVRWMQACALNPRCIMNSWKDDGSVNTPWLHSEVTGLIRAIDRVALVAPAVSVHVPSRRGAAARPVLRPTFWEFPGGRAMLGRLRRDAGRPEPARRAGVRLQAQLRARSICRRTQRRLDGAAITRDVVSGWRRRSPSMRRSIACRCSCVRAPCCRRPTPPTARAVPTSRRVRCAFTPPRPKRHREPHERVDRGRRHHRAVEARCARAHPLRARRGDAARFASPSR